MVKYGKNTICEKLLGREEREIEGKKREMREERDERFGGWKHPFLFFSPTLACWSVEGHA